MMCDMNIKSLTKKHIFECRLKDIPIEPWLVSTRSADPQNIADEKLLFETGVYVHHATGADADICIRVTHPMRVMWKLGNDVFMSNPRCTVDGVVYTIRKLEVDELLPYIGYIENEY